MLSSKERSYLKSLATKLDAIFQVGKQGITPALVEGISDALEKRELVKISVLDNAMMDVKEIADIISERSKSEVVIVIGKKIVLYRESKTKKVLCLKQREF